METVPGVLQQLPAARLLLGTELGRFVSKINRAKNAKQEDLEAAEEVSRLRVKFAAPHVPTSKMRDYLVTAIYCEMLGRSARDFGPLHAISFSQHAQTFKEKRIGYLAAAIFLRNNDDISIMLVNTLIKDLNSKADLEVAGALTLLHRLTISDTVPAVLPHVRRLLEHSSPLIRKKAVQAIHRFQISDTPQISEVHHILDRALTDTDFDVAAAGVALLADLVKADPHCNFQYAGKIGGILERLVEGRAPRGLVYHGVFAPWIQVQCLEVLGTLGSCSESVARKSMPLVLRTFNHAVGGVDAAYAVAYEAIRTLSKISPEKCAPRHLDVELADRDPASMIMQFLQLRNRNMRFLALSALPHIHRLEPWLVSKLQSTVVDHLADEDETLRRKAMNLVYLVAKNDTALIVGRLLSMLQASEDIPTRRAAASEIRSLLRRFSTDDESYVRASLTLMEEGGDVVEASFVRELLEFMRDRQFSNGGELAEWVGQHLREFAESKRKVDHRRHAFVQLLALYFTEFLGFHAGESRENATKFLCDILDALPGDSPTARILAAALLRIASEVANGPEIAERTRKKRVDMQGFDPVSADTFAFQDMVLNEKAFPPESSSSSFSQPASSGKHSGYAQVPVGIRYAPYDPPAVAQEKLQGNVACGPERRSRFDDESFQSSLSGTADYLGCFGTGDLAPQQKSTTNKHGLSVIMDKMARPDCVVVTFSCTNISEQEILDLALVGNVTPSYCKLKWRTVHPPTAQRGDVSPSGAGICVNVGNLPPTNSVLVALEVTPSSPYRALVPIIQAEATFRTADDRKSSVVVDVPTLTALDFLRPAGEFDVESFGEAWETMPSEAQGRTSSKNYRHVGIKEIRRKLAAADDRCNNARGFFTVQTVELEIIAAARVLNSSDYCLLHVQLPSEWAAEERWEVQVTAKAEEAEVAEEVVNGVVRSLEL